MKKWKQALAACIAFGTTSGVARADKVLYNSGLSDLILANADGSSPRYVVQNKYQIFDASLSYDEQSVFFAMHDFSSKRDIVYRVASNGSGLRELSLAGVRGIYRIACNPVDGRLAFIGTGVDGQRSVFVANEDGSGVRLIRSTNAPQVVRWRSDGKALVAVDKVSEPDGICLLLTPEGDVLNTFPLVAFRRDIEWDAGSGLLLFSSFASRRIVNDNGTNLLQGDIYTIRNDGSEFKQLTREGDNFTATFSPDGRRILYSMFRNEAGSYGGLRLMNTDGSQKRPVSLTLPNGQQSLGGMGLDWGPLPVAPSFNPSVLVVSPASGSISNRLNDIRGVAGDGNGLSDIASLHVTLRLQGGAYWNGRAFQFAPSFLSTLRSPLATNDKSFLWRVSTPLPGSAQLKDGLYIVEAVATDKAGHVARSASAVRIDLTPPQIPALALAFNNTRSFLTGTWRDAGSIHSISVQIRRGDGTFWNGRSWQAAPFLLPATLENTNASKTSGTFSLSAGLPPARELTSGSLLSILAIDRAGNRGGLQRRIGPAPSVPVG